MPLLEVNSLTKRFGGLTAVSNLSFSVEEGAVHGLIGPNGAGKTTTYNVISGFYAPTSGQVIYAGRDISGAKPSVIAELGLVRTFQSTTVYHEFSVYDNLRVSCHLQARAGLFRTMLGLNGKEERAADERSRELLQFFGLDDRRDELAMNLPHGLQRALGIAVALAGSPKLLLLDEPFTGMNPEETRHMMDLVRKVREHGVTVLLVEHDMQAVMGLCERITVLNFGRLLTEGTPKEIREHPDVIEAYLGAANDVAAG